MSRTPAAAAPDATDLSHHFLVAMPAMADPNFEGAVIYVTEHSDRGAMGLVINRPVEDLDLGTLLERIDLTVRDRSRAAEPVLLGGPVQTDRGFVLHQPVGRWNSTMRVAGGELGLTSSKDVLEAVAAGQGPERLLVTLGYSGWGPGQLEEELAQNAWLTVPASADVIFDVPPAERHHRAIGLLGFDPAFLSGSAGHA